MSSYEVAELISLAMTLPTIILAVAVVVVWSPAALRAVTKPAKEREGEDWFIVGVVAGFVGGTMDNLYWALPWTATFLESPLGWKLTMTGVFFNIFFRQGLGIVAAYCHLRAYGASGHSKARLLLAVLLGGSCVLGGIYSSVLLLLKTM